MSHFPTCNSGEWTSDESWIVMKSIAEVVVGKRVCSHLLKFPTLKWEVYSVSPGIHIGSHIQAMYFKSEVFRSIDRQTKAMRKKSERVKERESERALERE